MVQKHTYLGHFKQETPETERDRPSGLRKRPTKQTDMQTTSRETTGKGSGQERFRQKQPRLYRLTCFCLIKWRQTGANQIHVTKYKIMSRAGGRGGVGCYFWLQKQWVSSKSKARTEEKTHHSFLCRSVVSHHQHHRTPSTTRHSQLLSVLLIMSNEMSCG